MRRADGSISCGPFHVKFDKISTNSKSAPKERTGKIVKLKVNAQDANISMKLGRAGEAFFVERTREKTSQLQLQDPRDCVSPPPSSAAEAAAMAMGSSYSTHIGSAEIANMNMNMHAASSKDAEIIYDDMPRDGERYAIKMSIRDHV